MDRHTFLTWTSGSQWILFLALMLIVFSWIEHKKGLQQAGQLLFFLLGTVSLWIILSGQIVLPGAVQEAKVPVEAKALTYFSGLVINGVLGLAAFTLGWKNQRWVRPLNMLLMGTSLVLFFMVYHLLQQS